MNALRDENVAKKEGGLAKKEGVWLKVTPSGEKVKFRGEKVKNGGEKKFNARRRGLASVTVLSSAATASSDDHDLQVRPRSRTDCQ